MPATASRCGVKRASNGLSSTPWLSADTTPTANSDQPSCPGPQPNLNLVYSTQVMCSMNCARLASADHPHQRPDALERSQAA